MGGTFGESEEPSAARACKKYSEDTFVYKDTLGSPNWPFERMEWDIFPLDDQEKATGDREGSPKFEMLAGTLDGQSRRRSGHPRMTAAPENEGN